MITCNLSGGLGNQLFQIFNTISYALTYKKSFCFFNYSLLGNNETTIRPTYWNTFFHSLNSYLVQPYAITCKMFEKEFAYNMLPNTFDNHVMLVGYFQSYKYFQEHYNTICNLIQLNTLQQDILSKMNLDINSFTHTVSMHFRIGDYKSLQECHPVMPYKYYEKACNHLQNVYSDESFTILYFCEDVDINDVDAIIRPLQKLFPKYTFVRGDQSLTDWEQMLLMSVCHHNIIANSTFSWWAAYFNRWPDKTVCYPSVWFGPKLLYHNTKDLCPPEWHKIRV